MSQEVGVGKILSQHTHTHTHKTQGLHARQFSYADSRVSNVSCVRERIPVLAEMIVGGNVFPACVYTWLSVCVFHTFGVHVCTCVHAHEYMHVGLVA